MKTFRTLAPALLLIASNLLSSTQARAADDIVIADFEAADYGTWKTTGEAFGPGPARGTLPNQMAVSGYQGERLVNSYFNGDGTTGTLTSPEFKIERKFINFLVGGGVHPDETCLKLLVEGKVVRNTTGIDSENLEWETWDVAEFANKLARIEIIDKATGGWGHIHVDQIVQSDERKVEPQEVAAVYRERYRPQFHFTAKNGWLNDPNGLVFYKDEYHLFFQHNPQGINWGNMTWGHAVSPNLVHWKQLDNAIEPDSLGTIFSGSAVVDWNNTAGFQKGDEKTIVCIYTSAGGTSPESQGQPFTQSIAYSTDRGRTWTKYAGNPVLKHIVGGNRDPKVIWHEPTKKWVMALYLDKDQYALFSSKDLKSWDKLSDVPVIKDTECPDIFELPLQGKVDRKFSKWVFWDGNNNYLLGKFDGTNFVKESGPDRFQFGSNYYAAQTYSDIPEKDGRRIQIGWMSGGRYPKMPFNQQMSFPSELVLIETAHGPRIAMRPVKELESLHMPDGKWRVNLRDVKFGSFTFGQDGTRAYEVRATIDPGTEKQVNWNLCGCDLTYDVAKSELQLLGRTARVPRAAGEPLTLQILVDRTSVEVYAQEGQVVMSSCFLPKPSEYQISLRRGETTVQSLQIWILKSAWDEP